MEILKFKININSLEDQQKLSSILNLEKSVHKWHLDQSSPDSLLSVSGQQVDPQQIKNLLQQAGFKVEFVQIFGAGGGGL